MTSSLSSDYNEKITESDLEHVKSILHPEIRDKYWHTLLTAAFASAHLGAESVPLIYQMVSKNKSTDDVIKIQREIKESLIKGSVLFGIPSTLNAVFPLMQTIREDSQQSPERIDTGFYARKGQTLQGVHQRGMDQLKKVYKHNFDDIERRMGTEIEDIKTLTLTINYGWILSENSILDFPHTELVILAALIPQNASSEIMWHLRGSRRAGWKDEIISSVREMALEVGKRSGCRINKVPDLEDVKEEEN